MGFCCGASMVGTLGTLKHRQTYIHQVPVLFCPICQSIEVHPKVKDDYEILVDYAHSDQASEIFFDDYVDVKDLKELFADCIDMEDHSVIKVIRSQIDHALDLYSVAKTLQDEDWKKDLIHRLHVLTERLKRYEKKEKQCKR
jgi:hypothetical protein